MSILDPALAQKFIDKTAKYLEYNINVMNDKGIIIASKDATRIGDFHEVAYGMLNGTIDSGVVKENQKFLGTKPGVNMFIDYKNKHEGVICVTGKPETVHVFANLMKTFMEAMLEYELQMEGERRRKDKAEQFLYCLFFEENGDISLANSMAGELGLTQDILRAVIIIKHNSKDNPKKIVEALTKAEGYSCQDIITIARNDDIIMLKAINEKPNVAVKDYRFILEDYIKDFFKMLSEEQDGNRISFFVGSLQTDIEKYRASYIHAQQLSMQIKGRSGIFYFNDFILEYYRSLVTIKVYDNIFSIYHPLFTKEEKKILSETVDALSKNNYNVVNSAKALFIHRNTLLFRLNKIKDVLNIDPIANSADRKFLNELAHYFNHK